MEYIKTCPLCNLEVKVQNKEDFKKHFHISKRGKFGFSSFCKGCMSEEKSKYYKKYPEKMNATKEKKNHINVCIVCNKEFKAREKRHLTCSSECRKVKNRIKKRLNVIENNDKNIKIRNDIRVKATLINKHYTEEEKLKIIRLKKRGLSINEIALKMSRTVAGITKILKKINKS